MTAKWHESASDKGVLSRLRMVVSVTRAPFFTASAVPVLLGGAIAWSEGPLHIGYLVLTLVGALAVHAALNMGNDFFDHLSGNDAANPQPTPFSGGSRVIQEGILTARQMLLLSIGCYLLTAFIGIYLALTRGWVVLALGLAGIGLAVLHNWHPFGLYYLAPGLGEAAVGLGFGTLMVLGSYYVQTQHLSLGALWASIPVGLAIVAVLYINEFPDYRADKLVGKKTLVVVLGPKVAVVGYALVLIGVYVSILLGVLLGLMPFWSLLAFVTVPRACQNVRGAARYYRDIPNLLPTNAATIQLHLSVGLLLSLAYVLKGLLA